MKNKRWIKVLIAILIAVVLTGGIILVSAYIRSISANINMETGRLTGKIHVLTKKNQILNPGVLNDYTVSVQNTGNIAMLARVKIDKSWVEADNSFSGKNDDIQIMFNTDSWFDGKDGYYYYKEVLLPEQTSDNICEGFKLSSGLNNSAAYSEVHLTVIMECIQYIGDAALSVWGKDFAWYGNVPDSESLSSVLKEPEIATVTYISEKSEFSVSSEFAKAFNKMTPGQTQIRETKIVNSGSNTVEIFIKASLIDPDDTAAYELMQKYSYLAIKDENGRILFNGTVMGTLNSLSEEFSLGLFKKNQSKNFTMEISVDKNAGNEYQNIVNRMVWSFSATEYKNDENKNDTVFYTLTYNAQPGGFISGNTPQIVARGTNGFSVTAIAQEGYVFVGWSDGVTTATRQDLNILSDLDVTAIFKKIESADTPKVPGSLPELNKNDHLAYMIGYPDGTFKQEGNMTRAEVVVMFSRLLVKKINIEQEYQNSFIDVHKGAWYYNQIGYMEQFGIINGYFDKTFRPDAPITRAEFATIASRFDKLITDQANVFSDVPADYWAKDYISSAFAMGWVIGYPDGTFRPENYITRAEVVTITNRMLERDADRNFIDSNPSLIIDFKDLEKEHWAYYNIMEASNDHIYERQETSEIWEKIN